MGRNEVLKWPLLLAVSIGTVGTVMVSSLGEAAVSGVSLVDSINILLLMMMASLATGGAVVASQYIGKRDRVSACSAARQLVYAVTALSLLIMVVVLVFRRGMLQLIYSTLDADVMENAISYLTISAISYPFIALYNAGNAIAFTVSTFATLPGQAFGLAMLTVVGQCVGAKNYQSARRNTKKLMAGAILCLFVLCTAILLLRTPLLSFFNLSAGAIAIGRECLFYFCLMAPVFWPFSFSLPNALRAAGDARYTMVVSLFSMWTFRIGLSWLLAVQMGFGVLGVWYSMIVDWVVRSAFFAIRWQRGRWQSKRLI